MPGPSPKEAGPLLPSPAKFPSYGFDGHHKKSRRTKDKEVERSKKSPEKEPQTSRWAFTASLTSTKTPDQVLSHIVMKLLDMKELSVTKVDSYLLSVTDSDKKVEFQVEVCKLPVLSMCCVRFHRILGDSQTYQNIVHDVVSLITPL